MIGQSVSPACRQHGGRALSVTTCAVALLGLLPIDPQAGEVQSVLHVDVVPVQSCGGAKVEMEFEHASANRGYAEAIVTVSRRKHSAVVKVSDARDYVGVRCGT